MIRSLMIWLVLLALPFPGFAAATALPCAAATRADPAPAMAAMDQHGAMLHAGHQAPCAAGDDGGAGHHAGAKCGSCAACWVGAAMACASLSVEAQQPRSVAIPFDATPVPSFHPALPERPPRSRGA